MATKCFPMPGWLLDVLGGLLEALLDALGVLVDTFEGLLVETLLEATGDTVQAPGGILEACSSLLGLRGALPHEGAFDINKRLLVPIRGLK